MSRTTLTISLFLLIFIGIIISPIEMHAQPGDPGGDPDVPITGIEYLIGAGALFGLFRKYFQKKND